jgi:tetratricopeptide (TPR) repeat protein
MRTEFLLTLSILSLLCLTGLGDVGTIEYWLTKGAEEYVNGSLKEAFESFDNATTIDPENATVWFARGMALSGLKRYEEAISSYNKSIQIDEKNADVWYARATDEGYLGRMNDSLASYDQSLQIDPENKFVWYDKALALRSLGRTQEAEEAWSTYRDLSYAHISFSDNSGESMEDAIVIMNARTDLDGVGSEYYYLEKRFGTDAVDRDRISQYLVEDEEGRSYDVLEVHLTSGETATIYFDITDFYGKGFV